MLLAADAPTDLIVSAYWMAPFYSNGALGVDGPAEKHTWLLRETEAKLRLLSAAGKRVVVVGPVPDFQDQNLTGAVERAALGLPIVAGRPTAGFLAQTAEVLSALRRVEALPNVRVVYPHLLLCDAEQCRTFAEGKPLYMDFNHLSRFGAARVAPLIEAAFAEMSATTAHRAPKP